MRALAQAIKEEDIEEAVLISMRLGTDPLRSFI